MPNLSESTATFIRVAYGLLLIGTLLMAFRQGRRFFASERWQGYVQESPANNVLHHPITWRAGWGVWLLSAVALTLGWWSPWAALVNVLLCRHVFVQLRWTSILRGMGAPGFMTYWLGLAVLLLEYSRQYAPELESLVLLVLQIDLAAIMLSAGIYKLMAGYPRNEGMEYGLVNPMWGYWWKLYRRLPANHWLLVGLNQLAWSTEIAAGLLLLVPQTRVLGAGLIMVSFAWIATQIRLGLLCEMVIVSAFLAVPPGSLIDQVVSQFTGWLPRSTAPAFPLAPAVNGVLAAALVVYLGLLPFAHAGLFYNMYGRRSLPPVLQRALEAYTNLFGIIIWRVFSVDVVNFLAHVYQVSSGKRTLVSRYGHPADQRFTHVGELITVTSLFTTLKYHPSNSALFKQRLLRYARTLPCPRDAVLVFAYVSIVKQDARFTYLPVADYVVDPRTGDMRVDTLSTTASPAAAHAVSPVHEGVRPGSYAPLPALVYPWTGMGH